MGSWESRSTQGHVTGCVRQTAMHHCCNQGCIALVVACPWDQEAPSACVARRLYCEWHLRTAGADKEALQQEALQQDACR